MTAGRVSTFEVGDLLLGLDVLRVTEVVRDIAFVPVPLSHAGIAGVMNLRGRVLSVVDARLRLGVHRGAQRDGPGVHVIVQRNGEAASLLVDRVREVVDLSFDPPDELPDTIDPWIRSLTAAAYQLEALSGRLLLVLDPDALLDVQVNPRNEP